MPIDFGLDSIFTKEQSIVVLPDVEIVNESLPQNLTVLETITNNQGWNINPIEVLGIAFISISLLLFIRFIYRFGSIILIQTSSNRQETEDGLNLIFTDRTDNAFSFLGHIFINPLKFTDEEKRLIIEHEREHIRNFHSFDLILIELLIVLQWFNPFAYIARRKLIELHEFIADNGVIRKGADPYSYQNLLLSVVTSSCLPSAGNQLSAFITKKRIAMIGKPMNQTGRWINFLILIPIAAILIIGISAFSPIEPIKINLSNEGSSLNKQDIYSTPSESFKDDAKNVILLPKEPLLKSAESNKSKVDNQQLKYEGKNIGIYSHEAFNYDTEGTNLVPIKQLTISTLYSKPNSNAVEKLNIIQIAQQNGVSTHDELLKRANEKINDTYLKDLYFNLPPQGTNTDLSPNGYANRYSIILKKGCIYNLYYFSGSKDDKLRTIIGSGKGDESVIEQDFNFSYFLKKTFEPKKTAAYHLEIVNLSTKKAEALIYITLKESSDNGVIVSSTLQQENQSSKNELLARAEKEGIKNALQDIYFELKPNEYQEKPTITLTGGNDYTFNFLAKTKDERIDVYINSVDKEKPQGGVCIFSGSTEFNIHVKKTSEFSIRAGNKSSNSKVELLSLIRLKGIHDTKSDTLEKYISQLAEGEEMFMVVEQMPTFGNGKEDEFRVWVAANMKYPEEAAKSGIQGRVFVQFVVEKDGSITNAKVIKSINPILDKEAIRVVEASPKWNPGMQRGKAGRVSYTFPITFALQ